MREVWPGRPYPQGATYDGAGVNFAVYSRGATKVQVCLFSSEAPERELERVTLPELTDFVWHGYVPGLSLGTLYGLRVHGPHEPERGLRFNPHKLLVDPYARAIHGKVDWTAPVFGYAPDSARQDLSRDSRDSAAGVPKAVVIDGGFDWEGVQRPEVPWRETVIYEVHVRGLTMRHPGVPEAVRGTYAGLAAPAVLEHLTKLGVTAVELLPVHAAVDDAFLLEKGLSNYWGYNTLAYFAPEPRYASGREPGAAVRELKAAIKGLHAAGIEVILDVVYNHTCEGNHLGPTLSLKGIDNATYYWLGPEPRYYLDFAGTGNSLNAANPQAARLIVDSLRYWALEMQVDGFRFDLATAIGRTRGGEFDPAAPLFQIIAQDPVLSGVKLIAEPWDVGRDGYQVGRFAPPWREWNGKFRDAVRGFWRGDDNRAGEIGYRLAGSADLYQADGRRPQASINFVTSHDGFTLHDLVTHGHKHNEANGELNRDGADDNQSWNHGCEGETDDPEILAVRERQKRNLLATLFLAQGVPMLVAGDEMGRTQRGNNNAYCQDNELSWLDWQLDERRRALLALTRRLIALRHAQPVLQRRRFFRGDFIRESRFKDLSWYRPDGTEMTHDDWRKPYVRSLSLVLGGDGNPTPDERGKRVVGDSMLVLLNAHAEPVDFTLPVLLPSEPWTLVLDTADDTKTGERALDAYGLVGRSLAVFTQPPIAADKG